MFLRILFMSILVLTKTSYALIDIQGHLITAQQLKNKWLVINYWANWCAPCLKEIPELNKFYKTKPSNVLLYGINFDGLELDTQRALVEKLHINYPSLSSADSVLSDADVRGVPVTFIISPKGTLVKTLYGPQTAKDLSHWLHRLKTNS